MIKLQHSPVFAPKFRIQGANSTTLFQVNQADATVVLNVDTTNAVVNIGGGTYITEKLNIYGSGTLSRVNFQHSGTGQTSGDGALFGLNGVDFYFWNREDGRVYLGTNDAHGIGIYRGNVGVFTASPDAKLHIVGDADDQQLIVEAHSTQTANILEIQDSSANVLSGVDERGILFSDGGIDATSVYIGPDAGNIGHTNAVRNVGIGYRALALLTTGDSNVAIGWEAADSLTTGIYNVAIGEGALGLNQIGTNNMAIGRASLLKVNANHNVAVGTAVLLELTSGNTNTAIGSSAGTNNQTGVTNVYIGFSAGSGVASNSNSYNTFIGGYSGQGITTGSSNIFLGAYSGNKQTTLSNLLIVDNVTRANVATELTNSILYGVMAATPGSQTLRINARTGINITPTAQLTLPAGIATAGYAPLKFTAGTALTTPEAGVVEYHDDRFYLTNVACRKAIDRTSDVITATTTVANTTTETTIYTSPVAANALKVGNFIKQLTMGTLTTASAADTVTGRVKIGGATIATITSGGTGTHTDQPWHFVVNFTQREVGATAEIAYHIDLELDGTSSVDGQADIDTTSQADITITVEWNNAKAGNILDINQGITEYKN